MISLKTVANYFIWLGMQDKARKVSNKKLQKLVYYAQAWSLALFSKPLFSEEIEAWIHGPAIPFLYGKFKEFGFNSIEIKNLKIDTKKLPQKKLLDEVWRVYGKYDADYLELLTHREDPWIKARNRIEMNQAPNILLKDMEVFYKKLLSDKKS